MISVWDQFIGSWEHYFIETLGFVFGFVVTFAPLVIYAKRRKQRQQFSDTKQLEAIDYKALNEAEEAVKNFDLKKYLYENFVMVIELQTLHGYDENSMTDLVVNLKEKGIHSEYHFIQALPLGKGSATQPIGTYQLFVEKDKVEEGTQALSEIIKV